MHNPRMLHADRLSPIPDITETRELARILGIPAATLVTRRRAGLGPRAVKIGREWCYLREHVLEWLTDWMPADRRSAV